MDSLQKISSDLVQSINEKEKKKSIPYDTYAKVIRIDGGTAWVHIPGGVDETPVALTVNAKVGDSVLVRVSGGNAWIVGNSSAPPTDDTKAVEAKGVADVAQVKAETAQETAESAEEVAKNASRAVKSTNQHFWHNSQDSGAGEGAGAHITEVPQEDFIADPSNGGGNTLITSTGIRIRDGITNLATFSSEGVQIGQNGQSRLIQDYHSIQLIDNENRKYMHISDLRDADGYITDTFDGDGETKEFKVGTSVSSTSSNVVMIDGVEITEYTRSEQLFTFDIAPLSGSVITIKYLPFTTRTKAYTLGIRKTGAIGLFSFVEGNNNLAAAECAHAEGYDNQSIEAYSHTEGAGNINDGYVGHVEGADNQLFNSHGHVEGNNNIVRGARGHAEGYYNVVGTLVTKGLNAHAEGSSNTADGNNSHAEGAENTASGINSHVEGYNCVASGDGSHAQNNCTIAASYYQTAIGKYNKKDSEDTYAFIIGNGTGTSEEYRDNALTVDWDGNVKAAGSITASGHATAIGYKTGRETGTYSLATGKNFVTVPESALSRITLSEGTWIIHAHAAFASNNTGRRSMRIYDTTTSEGLTRSYVNQPATIDAATNMQTMAIVSLEESNTFTLQLAQNSGSAKSVDLVLEAIRIA